MNHQTDHETETHRRSRPVVRVPFYAELVDELLRGHATVFAGLPDDARMVNFYHDSGRDVFYAIVRSESFDKVNEGEEIPVREIDIGPGPTAHELVEYWSLDEGHTLVSDWPNEDN